MTTTPPGASRERDEREELLRDEVRRDRVGEEGVDHDHVPALLVAGEEPPPVADVDLQPRVAGQPEVPVGDVDDHGIELDRVQPQLREVAPHPLLRRAGAEADEEDVLRGRVVGDPEVEEIRVAVARPEGVVPVHRALERVVEAEVARVLVVDDGEPVVARVLGEDDLQILRLDDRARVARVQVAVAARAEERRPVLRRGGGQRLDPLRAERDRVEARGDGQRAGDGDDRVEPPRQPDEPRGGEERRGAEDEQLLDAELGDQPERGRERADDAAGGRDRERPTRRPARPLEARESAGAPRSGRPPRAGSPSAGRESPCRGRGRAGRRDPSGARLRSRRGRAAGSRARPPRPPRSPRRASAARGTGRPARRRASSRPRARRG